MKTYKQEPTTTLLPRTTSSLPDKVKPAIVYTIAIQLET